MKNSQFKAAVAVLLAGLVLAGCYNPDTASQGSFPAGQTGGAQAMPSPLAPVNVPTPNTPPAVGTLSPLLRVADPTGTARGSVQVKVKGQGSSVTIKVSKLDAEVLAPLGVFLENALEGDLTQVGDARGDELAVGKARER